MANNYNDKSVSAGKLYVHNGVECVKWGSDQFEHKTLSAEEFKALSGNDPAFMDDWSNARYPVLCNGWLMSCVASFRGNGVRSVMFLINNAVCPDLTETFGRLTLTLQNGSVSCEIVNL